MCFHSYVFKCVHVCCLRTDMKVCSCLLVSLLPRRWVCVRPAFPSSEESENIIWRKVILEAHRTQNQSHRDSHCLMWGSLKLNFQKFPRFLFVKHFYWGTDHVPDMYCQLVLSVKATAPKVITKRISWSSFYWGIYLGKAISNFFFWRQVNWDKRPVETFKVA